MASVNQAFSEFKREVDNLMEDLYEDVPVGVEQVERSVASNGWKEQIMSEGHVEPLETQVISAFEVIPIIGETWSLVTASGSKLSVSAAHGEQHAVCFKRPGQP